MDEATALERVQRYLIANRTRERAAEVQQVTVGPFQVLLDDADDSLGKSVGFPTTLALEAILPWLDPLRETFLTHGRRPALQWADGGAAGLVEEMRSAGWREHARDALLACTLETLRPPALRAEISLARVDGASSLDEVRENLDVNALGFDTYAARVTDEQAESFRADFGAAQAITARWEGQAAAAGMYVEPDAGVTELAGIATLERYRGRGTAAALTAALAQTAFDAGCDLVFLTTTNLVAERVYRRVGFAPIGSLLTYADDRHA